MEALQSFFRDNSGMLIPVIMFLSVLLIGVVAKYYSKKNKLIRAFKRSRRKSVGSIRSNEYAKILGVARAIHKPLKAPLSGRMCMYYQVSVYLKRGKNWQTIIKETKQQDFFVETNTEKVLVHLSETPETNTLCYLIKDYKESSQWGQDISTALEAYLKKHNKKRYGAFGTKLKLKCIEGAIEENERIAVKGIAKWETLDKPVDGYSYSKILTITGSKKEKLLITDEPKALLRINDRL